METYYKTTGVNLHVKARYRCEADQIKINLKKHFL